MNKLQKNSREEINSIKNHTYTHACGIFFEKSHASPRSEIRTWPLSSNRIFAG